MTPGWLDAYHRECSKCTETTTDDRESRFGYYWIRRVRRCGGRDVDFNYSLMEGGTGKSKEVARICTATFHGETVHAHTYRPKHELSATGFPCTPRVLDSVREKLDVVIAENDEYQTSNWRAGRWAHVLANS